MQCTFASDQHDLALQRNVLAAERTFSAWVRTGLACMGGGLALGKAIGGGRNMMAVLAGEVMVALAAVMFIFALVNYGNTFKNLSKQGIGLKSVAVMLLISGGLVFVAVLVAVLLLAP